MKGQLLESSKLMSKDALQKEVSLGFPLSTYLNTILYYLQIYTKEIIKRDIN